MSDGPPEQMRITIDNFDRVMVTANVSRDGLTELQRRLTAIAAMMDDDAATQAAEPDNG